MDLNKLAEIIDEYHDQKLFFIEHALSKEYPAGMESIVKEEIIKAVIDLDRIKTATSKMMSYTYFDKRRNA